MEKITHSCIKCGAQYQDTEQDAYYCPLCIEEKKRIAAEVDAKIAMRPRRKTPMSDFKIYNEMCKNRGTAFVPIKDLGIKL